MKVNHISAELLAAGGSRFWPKTYIDGNAGGGIPYGVIQSRREDSQLSYGAMRGVQEYDDRRDAVMVPTFRHNTATARAIERMESVISRGVALGYWAGLGGEAPAVNQYPANQMEAPNSSDVNLAGKIAF
jgi:hypothetical protein